MNVVHFQRRPHPHQCSIESLFDAVRRGLSGLGCDARLEVLPRESRGLGPRVESLRWVGSRQGEVNHITGDVHFIALGLDRSRTILTVHDLEMLTRLGGWRRAIVKLFWFTLPLRRVACVTVISQSTKTELVRECGVDPARVRVVPNIVDPAYRPAPRKPMPPRPTVLQIGTKANKNLPRLFAALEGLPVRLHLVGGVGDEHRRLAERHGVECRFSSRLPLEEMVAAYADADLVTLPSTVEGFGMPIVEAQWVERPVVTSNCSSMPEVAGDGACFVDPFDVASIREGVQRVIGDPAYRDSLIERGRENRRRFEVAGVAAAYLDLYRGVAAGALPE